MSNSRHFNPLDREKANGNERTPNEPVCKYCGSTEVRWRQQGGRWVLFSLTPGVVHTCDPSDLL